MKQSKLFLAIILVISILGTIAFAATKNNSKEFYTGLLKELKSRSELADMINSQTKMNKKVTLNYQEKFDYDTEVIAKYRKLAEELYDNASEEARAQYPNREETIDMLVDDVVQKDVSKNIVFFANNTGTKFLLEQDGKKLLLDRDKNKVFFKENNKTYYSDLSYSAESDIRSLDNNKMYSYFIQILLDNLKDEYFTESKENGFNVYKLSMNDAQCKEFCENVIRSSLNEEIRSLATNMDDEEIEEFINKMKQLKNLKFEIVTKIKGNSFDGLSSIDLVFTANNISVKFNLKGLDKKTIWDSKKFEMDLLFNQDNNVGEIKCVGSFTDNQIGFNYEVIDNGNVEQTGGFMIETTDKKSFLKSNQIVIKIEDYGTKEIDIHSIDNKPLLNSKGVEVLCKEDSEIVGTIKVISDDGKEFSKSKKLVMTVDAGSNSDKIVLTLFAEDNKELLKSTHIIFNIKESDYDFNRLEIQSLDKKAILESSYIDYIVYSYTGDHEVEYKVSLKANDNKKLKDSKDLTMFLYQSYRSDKDHIYHLKSNDNKKFLESSDLLFEYTNVDKIEESFTLELKFDKGKNVFNTTSVHLEVKKSTGTIVANISSKDRSPLAKAKQYKGDVKVRNEDIGNSLKFDLVFDGNNFTLDLDELLVEEDYRSIFYEGYDGIYWTHEKIVHLSTEEVKEINFESGFDINIAEERSVYEYVDNVFLDIPEFLEDLM